MIIKITFPNLLHDSDLLCFYLHELLMSLRRIVEPLEKKRISRGFYENCASFDFEFSIYMYYIKAICRDVKIYKPPQISAALIWADL